MSCALNICDLCWCILNLSSDLLLKIIEKAANYTLLVHLLHRWRRIFDLLRHTFLCIILLRGMNLIILRLRRLASKAVKEVQIIGLIACLVIINL